jgi:hypothetical protein
VRPFFLFVAYIISCLACCPEADAAEFHWSFGGALPGYHCVKTNEPADPDTWDDNFICSDTDVGLAWSYAGPVAGKKCVNINEPADPHTWGDNYLCVDANSDYTLSFSSSTRAPPEVECLIMDEPSDRDTWKDNYLCWTKATRKPATVTGSVACAVSGDPFARGGCGLAHSTSPEGWVRAGASLNHATGVVDAWIELESDSTTEGPCGNASITLRDANHKDLAVVTLSKDVCRGGKNTPHADQNLVRAGKQIVVPYGIAQKTTEVIVTTNVNGKQFQILGISGSTVIDALNLVITVAGALAAAG